MVTQIFASCLIIPVNIVQDFITSNTNAKTNKKRKTIFEKLLTLKTQLEF